MFGKLSFCWLGVAGFTLDVLGYTLAVDPFFSRPRLGTIFGGRPQARPELGEQYLPACQAILITHAHHDHLMDAPGIAQRTGAKLYGSPNSCQIALICGLGEEQTQVVRPGEKLQMGPFQVEVISAQHPAIPFFGPGELPAGLQAPLKLVEYRMDADYSYRIETDGLSLLNWAGVTSPEEKTADLLVCGAGKRGERLRELLEVVQPRLVIPTHWDNLFRPLDQGLRAMPGASWMGRDAGSFARRVRQIDPKVQVWIPEIFKSLELGVDGDRKRSFH